MASVADCGRESDPGEDPLGEKGWWGCEGSFRKELREPGGGGASPAYGPLGVLGLSVHCVWDGIGHVESSRVGRGKGEEGR